MTDKQYQAWQACLDALRVALATKPVFDHTACGKGITGLASPMRLTPVDAFMARNSR